MKKCKISTLIITSIIMLSGCQANNNDTSSAASEELSVNIETTSISLTYYETSVFEVTHDEQAVSEITTETSIAQSLTETETAITHTEMKFSEIIPYEIFDEETSAPQNEEKSNFYFDIEDDYAERYVDNLTGDAELFEHFNDAFFIYRELYTGIGFMAEKVFKNHGIADDSTGLVSTGVAYSDYKQFLGLYFTEKFIENLGEKGFIVNFKDDEVYYNEWFMGARGGEFYFVGAELTIAEKSDEQITLTLTSYFSGKEVGDYSFEDRTEEYAIVMINTENGWRFDNMTHVC